MTRQKAVDAGGVEKDGIIMYQIDFEKPLPVYFIGIGGISMSGLAEILMREGFLVSGSDAHESELTRHLESQGARIFYGHRAENLPEDAGLVVYTAAIHPDNPEYGEAVRRGIRDEAYAEGETIGEARGIAKSILLILEKKGSVSEELRAEILEEKDIEILKVWLGIAAASNNVEEYVNAT